MPIADVFKKFRFEAAHLIPGLKDGHKCGRLHGHSWTVELQFSGKVQKDGMVIDFGLISGFFKPILDQLDHRYLNDFIDIPTSENVAIWIWKEIFGALYPCGPSMWVYQHNESLGNEFPELISVTVEETCTSRAVYRGN